jgi:hypothetical protein
LNGFLVGGASLKPESVNKMLEILNKAWTLSLLWEIDQYSIVLFNLKYNFYLFSVIKKCDLYHDNVCFIYYL